MKITDIEINDKVTFKHGDNLEFVDTGVVFHKEDDCLHVEVKEIQEVFEVIESEILESWTMDEEREELCASYERMRISNYGPMVDKQIAETFL
tara:strand:- start:190 stop:468 length:279 start_codon:yes stop_codon:yes gene_type:complete